MKKTAVCLFAVLIFISVSYAQENKKPVAKAGNIPITKEEFTARYELTPLPGMHQKKTGEAIKERFLYTLVGEKLLALGALEDKLDTNEIVRFTLKTFEKMFVRDALYKKVVKEAAAANADSLLTVYISQASRFSALYIPAINRNEADRIHGMLKKGIPFDTIYAEQKEGLNDTLSFRIGDLDEASEKVFIETPVNSFTPPLFINDKWMICRILAKVNPVTARLTTWENDYKNLQKVASERAEQVYYQRFMSTFFKGKQIRSNGKILQSIAAKISSILSDKIKAQANSDKVYLDIPDLLVIEKDFGPDSLGMTYIVLEGKDVSLKEFLRHFRFESFYTDKTDFNSVGSLLNGKTKKFIEEELLSEEGYRRGLQNSPEVKESYGMWRDNYLSKVERAALSDTVIITEKDIDNELIKEDSNASGGTEIKLVEIVTDSLDVVERVLNELKAGNDIITVAKKYSKKNVPDDTGFLPVESFGANGKIALEMNTGEVYGPLKTDEGYSIFKLLAKRENKNNNIETDRALIKNRLYYQRGSKAVNNRIVSLANKYNVNIDKAVLDEVKPSNITSIVFRYLGFGGRITAVPFVAPDDEWVKQWRENSNNIQ